MKALKLLVLFMLLSLGAFAQGSAWSSTPTVITQSRVVGGVYQIRFLTTTKLYSLPDTLAKLSSSYTNGYGLLLTGTQFRVDSNYITSLAHYNGVIPTWAINRYVPNSRTVAGFPLSSNITLAPLTNGYGVTALSYNGSTAASVVLDTTAIQTKTGNANKTTNSPAIGTIYNFTTFPNLTGFTKNGAQASVSGGVMTIADSTGTGGYLHSIGNSQQTNLDKWTLKTTFVVPTMSATSGLAIGIAAVRSGGTTVKAVNLDVSTAGTSGQMTIVGGTSGATTLATSAAQMTFTAGDTCDFYVTRDISLILGRVINRTHPQVDVNLTFQAVGGTVATTGISNVQKVGYFSIFAKSSTPIQILQEAVWSLALKNADIAVVGDSKSSGGAATTQANTLCGILSRYYQIIDKAGQGDYTTDVLNEIAEIIAIKPKCVVLDIGRNDLVVAGTALATVEANLNNIVSQLATAGIKVFVCNGTYEPGFDLSPYAAYIRTTFPTSYLETFNPIKFATNALFTDGVHLSDEGYQIKSKVILDAVATYLPNAQVIPTINNFDVSYATGQDLSKTGAITSTNFTNSTYGAGTAYFNASGTLLETAAGSTTGVLHGGATPVYGKVVLTTDVSGINPVANGGTGVATLTGLVKANGTSAFTAAVSGTDYQAPITLTTTGTSGAATFSGNTLNIPQYAGATYTASNGVSLTSNNFSLDQAFAPTWTGTHTFLKNGIATTPTDAIFLANNTAATSGAIAQYSPAINFYGYGYSASTSTKALFRIYNAVTGGSVISSTMNFDASINNGTSWTNVANLSTNGGFYSSAISGMNITAINYIYAPNVTAGNNNQLSLQGGYTYNGTTAAVSVHPNAIMNTTGISSSFAILSTTSTTGTGGTRALWVSPYETSNTGSGIQMIWDFGKNSAANGLGTNTSYFGGNDVGNWTIGGTAGANGQSPVSNGTTMSWATFASAIPTTTITTNQSAVAANRYVTNSTSRVVLTLPTTASVGDVIFILGLGTGGWQLGQNAGQTIHGNASDTTTGTTGYVASQSRYNCAEFRCILPNTDWILVNSNGALTTN